MASNSRADTVVTAAPRAQSASPAVFTAARGFRRTEQSPGLRIVAPVVRRGDHVPTFGQSGLPGTGVDLRGHVRRLLMAHRTNALTEQQREILKWIGDGCPAGVMTDDSHRISAAALRRRGLVRITGRGPTPVDPFAFMRSKTVRQAHEKCEGEGRHGREETSAQFSLRGRLPFDAARRQRDGLGGRAYGIGYGCADSPYGCADSPTEPFVAAAALSSALL
jgi:hypothetical protein